MPIVNALFDVLGWMQWYIVPFLVIMNVIVFIHEMGHYLVGRWCGVKVEAFSLGFGPELLHVIDSHGTRWRLALFPIGGYVKFLGDANAASGQDDATLASVPLVDRSRTLAAQPVWERAAIVAAGPAANFLLAMVLFTAIFYATGQSVHNGRIGLVEKKLPRRGRRLPDRRSRDRHRRREDQELPRLAAGGGALHRHRHDVLGRPGRPGADPPRRAADHDGRPGLAGQAAHGPPWPGLDPGPRRRQLRTLRIGAMRGLGGRRGRLHHQGDALLYRRPVRRARVGRADVERHRHDADHRRGRQGQLLGIVQSGRGCSRSRSV